MDDNYTSASRRPSWSFVLWGFALGLAAAYVEYDGLKVHRIEFLIIHILVSTTVSIFILWRSSHRSHHTRLASLILLTVITPVVSVVVHDSFAHGGLYFDDWTLLVAIGWIVQLSPLAGLILAFGHLFAKWLQTFKH